MFLTDRQHLPPANWQDLESLCAKLFRHIWRDDKIQRFGRNGQRQKGVDIAGRPHWGGIEGIQCKLKDTLTGKALTLGEVKREIAKAEKFQPPLACLTFATTAPPDAALQSEVFKIAQKRKLQSRFDVVLLSWTDLLDRIEEIPELAEIYGGHAKKITETHEGVFETVAMVRELHQKIMAPQPPDIEDLLGSEIDAYRDLLRENKARLALELLENLRKRRWRGASQKSQYRILTNIAAAKTRLGRIDGADDHIAALALDPDGEQAICNAAWGHLIKNEFIEARELARRAVAKFPKSVSAHAILLAATSGVGDAQGPLQLVPEELRGEPAIAFGIGNFYRFKKNFPEARKWFDRAFKKDPEQVEIKIAFAEQLLGDVLADRRAVATGQLSSAQQDDLKRAAHAFFEIWEAVKGTDVALVHVNVAMNLSTARQLLGDRVFAATVLDEALRAKPDDTGLKIQRAFVAGGLNDYDTALTMLFRHRVRSYAAAAAHARRASDASRTPRRGVEDA
jgi:cellulose synthase operon protein C